MKAPPLSSNDKRVKKKPRDTAGPLWFNLPRGKLTPQNKLHFLMLKYRHLLYRDYKPSKIKDVYIPKYFGLATVVEGPTEYYSSRLSNKERKKSWHEQYLSDDSNKDWFKTKISRATSRLQRKQQANHWWRPLKKFRLNGRYNLRKKIIKTKLTSIPKSTSKSTTKSSK